MSEKVERALVQGTVTFKVSCNDLKGLVEPEIANNYYKLENWLKEKAINLIELSSVEVEIDNVESVTVTQTTSDNCTNRVIDDSEWKQIKKEDKQ